MNLVLFGAPGSGKGTQSNFLVEKKSFKHFSTGDLFRANIKGQTELGMKAKSFIDQGQLVPDSVTVGMIREELVKLTAEDSFILDGFPRNQAQADALKEVLEGCGLRLDKAIFLEVPKEKLTSRLTGRRLCKGCSSVYHMEFNPPQKEGVCDKCGGEVYQRPDDNIEVIENRLNVYEENTAPLKDYYKSQGIYEEVDGTGAPELVFERLTSALEN